MSQISDAYKDYEANRLRYAVTDKTYLKRPKLMQRRRAQQIYVLPTTKNPVAFKEPPKPK